MDRLSPDWSRQAQDDAEENPTSAPRGRPPESQAPPSPALRDGTTWAETEGSPEAPSAGVSPAAAAYAASDGDDAASTSVLSDEDVMRMTLAARRREVAALRAQNAALHAAAAALGALASESSGLASTLAITAAFSRPRRPAGPSPWADAAILPQVDPMDFHAFVVDAIWRRGQLPGPEWVAAAVNIPFRVRAAMEQEFHLRVYTQLGEWRGRWAEREVLSAPVELAIKFRNASHAAYYAVNEGSYAESVARLAVSPLGTPEGDAAHARLAGVLAAIVLTDAQRATLRRLLGEYEAEVAAAAATAGVASIGLAAAAHSAEGGGPEDSRGGEPVPLATVAEAAAAAARGAVGLAAAHNRNARAYVMLFEKSLEVLSWTQFAAGSMLLQPTTPDARQFCELACGLCRCAFCTGEGARVAAAAAGRGVCPKEWNLAQAPRPAAPPPAPDRPADPPSLLRLNPKAESH